MFFSDFAKSQASPVRAVLDSERWIEYRVSRTIASRVQRYGNRLSHIFVSFVSSYSSLKGRTARPLLLGYNQCALNSVFEAGLGPYNNTENQKHALHRLLSNSVLPTLYSTIILRISTDASVITLSKNPQPNKARTYSLAKTQRANQKTLDQP